MPWNSGGGFERNAPLELFTSPLNALAAIASCPGDGFESNAGSAFMSCSITSPFAPLRDKAVRICARTSGVAPVSIATATCDTLSGIVCPVAGSTSG